MDKIEWVQVIVAFLLGVMLATTVKTIVAHLRGQAAGALS